MPQTRAPRKIHHLIRTRELFISACFVFISLGVVAAWFISADSTSSLAGIEPYVRFMLSPWMLFTHTIALSFIAFGLWFLGAPSLKPSAVSNFDVTLRQCGLPRGDAGRRPGPEDRRSSSYGWVDVGAADAIRAAHRPVSCPGRRQGGGYGGAGAERRSDA